MYEYAAKVARVVDGDTVHLNIDLGFDIWRIDASVRIAHINAPELKTVEGRIAANFAMSLLPVGSSVVLKSHELDKYGRVLGTLTLPDGQDFGKLMLDAAHAVPYEGGAR
jgi:micrococcal nuclease